jgi:hypothetical protein
MEAFELVTRSKNGSEEAGGLEETGGLEEAGKSKKRRRSIYEEKEEEKEEEEEEEAEEEEEGIKRKREALLAEPIITNLDKLLTQYVIITKDDDDDDIYDFKQDYRTSDSRKPVYAGLKDFLLLPFSTHTLDLILHTKQIGDKFGYLFREPSLKLLPSVGGGGGNNMPLISKYALELVLYLIDYLKENPQKAALLTSRLDLFDNAVPFISSTLRQIVFWKKISLDKEDKEMLYALRLCKKIKDIFFTSSGRMIVVHFCVNKLLTLWVEITKRKYVKNSAVFDLDRTRWECHLDISIRHDSKLRLTRLKKSKDILDIIGWIDYDCPPITPVLTPTPKVCENDGVCWRQNPDHWINTLHQKQRYPVKKPRTTRGGSTRQAKMDTYRRRRRSFSTRTARTRPHLSTKRRRHTRRRHRH